MVVAVAVEVAAVVVEGIEPCLLFQALKQMRRAVVVSEAV